MGTLQINALLDTLIAMWPIWVAPTILGMTYPLDTGSASILFFSQRLYQFPLGVFGVAVATVVFPMLARRAHDSASFAQTLRRGIRLSLFIAMPAGVGLWLVRRELIAVMFTGGSFGFSADGAARAAAVLGGYSLAVWAYSLNHVLTRAFYAMGDTLTPVRVSVAMVALNVALNLVLIWPLREAGLAWSTAFTAVLQCLILVALSRRLLPGEPLFDTSTRRALARIAGLTLAMAGLVLVTRTIAPEGTAWTHSFVSLLLAAGVGTLGYLALARAVRSPELSWLLHRD